MTARLKAICSLIDRTESFIDVGCDHGYAVKYVLDNRLADRITACDISEKSLGKAKKLIGDGAEYVCADGANAADGYKTVLVSGLGGLEITKIISSCRPEKFILSPQSHVREVRERLISRGYFISFDKVIRDGKFYDVIKAELCRRRHEQKNAEEFKLEFGMYADEYNKALYDKVSGLLNKYESFPDTEENVKKLRLIKEVLRWQSR